jgi:hypothetical protein
MRALFLLLVLANLAYFAYAHVTREGAGGGSLQQLQIAPDRIKLMKPPAPGPAEKPKAPGKAIPPALKVIAPSGEHFRART